MNNVFYFKKSNWITCTSESASEWPHSLPSLFSGRHVLLHLPFSQMGLGGVHLKTKTFLCGKWLWTKVSCWCWCLICSKSPQFRDSGRSHDIFSRNARCLLQPPFVGKAWESKPGLGHLAHIICYSRFPPHPPSHHKGSVNTVCLCRHLTKVKIIRFPQNPHDGLKELMELWVPFLQPRESDSVVQWQWTHI